MKTDRAVIQVARYSNCNGVYCRYYVELSTELDIRKY
jgi:hypothetical protein